MVPISSSMHQQPREWYEEDLNQGLESQSENYIYGAAKARLLEEMSSKEREILLSDEFANMDSLVEVLRTAMKKYQNRQSGKAWKWLSIFSAKVLYYGKVLDVLVNHYPQYVSLAWGAMKFLFVTVVNSEEMTTELAKAYSVIADILPRTDFTLILYPTQAIRDLVAQLYAYIMLFTSRAIRWFRKSKFAHAMEAIARPWSLNWKDAVDSITEQSRKIDSLAQTAARAELRDTRLEVQALRSEFKDMSTTSYETYAQMKQMLEKLSLSGDSIQSVVNTTQSLVKCVQIRPDLQKSHISTQFLAEIQKIPWVHQVPSAEITLEYCKSAKKSRKAPKLQMPDTAVLNAWATKSTSQLLFITSKSLQASKDFTVDLADVMQKSSAPTILVLRNSAYWETRPTYVSILKTMTLQALQLFPACCTDTFPVTPAQLMAAKNEIDWRRLLSRVLQNAKELYILFDAELVTLAGNHHRYQITSWLSQLIQLFQGICVLKMFISSTVIDRRYISQDWEAENWCEITTDYIVPTSQSLRSPNALSLSKIQRLQPRMGIKQRRR